LATTPVCYYTYFSYCKIEKNFINVKGHVEWREGPGPMTARQPALQGDKASPQGTHKVNMANETRGSPFGRFFVFMVSDLIRSLRLTLWAHAPKMLIPERTAAIHLLADCWTFESQEWLLDPFHWVDDEGLLSVADLKAVVRKVWPVAENGNWNPVR